MLSINFNNKNSFTDFGLRVVSRPLIPTAERAVEFIEVQGRNGALTVDKGMYKDISIRVSFNFYQIDKDIFSKCLSVSSWLKGCGNLCFSHIPNITFKVKAIKVDDIETVLRSKGQFSVTFICDPFKYGNEVIRTLTTNNYTFNYLGTIEAEPIIKIYGSGDITLSINSKNVILKAVNSYITIDSKLKDCYKDAALTNSQMNGEFPFISQGINTISWIGSITKIDLTYNETYL